ncbi:MAG: HAD-IA family hydrolase [Cyclobacteriaceae bacterium]
MSVRLSELNTIIFDLGEVIVDLHPNLVLKRFEELLGSTRSNIPELIKDTNLLIEYEKGRMSTSEFIQASNDFLKSEIPEEDFIAAWNLMIGDIPSNRLTLLRSLKATHQVLVLSNTNEMHELYFEGKIRNEQQTEGLSHYVHHPLYSHKIDRRKPEKDIYEYVIDNFLEDASKALFLDDKIENVDAAINSGMQSIQVEYPDQIFEILSND